MHKAMLLAIAAAAGWAQPLTPCEPPQIAPTVLCGFVSAPADHARPDGAAIRLRVLVLKATQPDPAPDPLVYLAGGPGSPATASAAPLSAEFAALRRRRDIVLIDQRGTGDSVPYNCSLTGPDGRPAALTSLQLSPQLVEICAKGPGAAAGAPPGMDARLFTTAQAADDVASVAAALGYPQVNLYGVSYGTRLGLVFLNRHPDLVRTLSLQGVVLPDAPIPVTASEATQRAIERIVEDCERDAACSSSYPRFRQQLVSILTERSRPLLASAVTAVLYSAAASAGLPAAVAAASEGDSSRLLNLASGAGTGAPAAMSNGVYLSILCAEDTPFITPADLERLARDTLAGDTTVRALMRTCSPWPRGAVAESDRALPTAARPVLLISGELDPVTPPGEAQRAADRLPDARHVILRGTGHAGAANACATAMVTQFVELAGAAGVETGCAASWSRPRFEGPLLPPPPR
jgi:pimeloyl-ACP methyl ester carboxylesterase